MCGLNLDRTRFKVFIDTRLMEQLDSLPKLPVLIKDQTVQFLLEDWVGTPQTSELHSDDDVGQWVLKSSMSPPVSVVCDLMRLREGRFSLIISIACQLPVEVYGHLSMVFGV